MKPKLKHLFSFLSLICLFAHYSQGQTSCVKTVDYTIYTSTTHALDNQTSAEELSVLDLLKGKEEKKQRRELICIDAEGFITQTNDYQYETNSFYPNFITKTVITPEGLSAYDKEGDLFAFEPPLPDTVQTPGKDLALTADEIDHYGLGIDFNLIIDVALDHAVEMGDQYWNTGNKYYFTDAFSEYIIDPDNKYTAYKEYDEHNELELMSLQTYHLVDGHQIPQYQMDYVYSNLSNGSKLQTTTTAIYLSYEVKENGQSVVTYNNDDFDSDAALNRKENEKQTAFGVYTPAPRSSIKLEISPNPASHQVLINFANTWQGKNVNVTLFDSQSRMIQTYIKQTGKQSILLDISELNSGIYFLKFNAAGIIHAEKLIVNNQ